MAKGDYTSKTRVLEGDTPTSDFVTLYTKDTGSFPGGEWFFKGDDGVENTLKGADGTPTPVVVVSDMNVVSDITTALGVLAGSTNGQLFTVVDAINIGLYTWFDATITPDEAYVVAGSSGTFIGTGPRWINARTSSNADFNQMRNFYSDKAAMEAALPVADWHGIMPAHSHEDDFGNVIGQSWTVHAAEFIEYLTTANHSGTLFTGLMDGGIMSVEPLDATRFQVTGGRGIIADFTDTSGNVTIQYPFWDQFDDETVILGDFFTTVAIDWNPTTGVASLIKRSGGIFTPEEHRQYIVLGSLNHSNGTSISQAINNPIPTFNMIHNIMDWVRVVGGQETGLAVNLSNSNLTWSTDAGTFTLPNVNYANNRLSPSTVTYASDNPVTFNYNSQNGGGGWDVDQTTTIVPDFYDTGAPPLTAVPAGKWTIQPDFHLGSANFHVLQRGQAVFDSKSEAMSEINTQTATMLRNPDLINFEIDGYFVVQQGATDLTDSATAVYIGVVNQESVIVADDTKQPNYTNVVHVDATQAQIDGIVYQTYAAAVAYILALPGSPSYFDAWDIVMHGSVTAAGFVLNPYIRPIGLQGQNALMIGDWTTTGTNAFQSHRMFNISTGSIDPAAGVTVNAVDCVFNDQETTVNSGTLFMNRSLLFDLDNNADISSMTLIMEGTSQAVVTDAGAITLYGESYLTITGTSVGFLQAYLGAQIYLNNAVTVAGGFLYNAEIYGVDFTALSLVEANISTSSLTGNRLKLLIASYPSIASLRVMTLSANMEMIDTIIYDLDIDPDSNTLSTIGCQLGLGTEDLDVNSNGTWTNRGDVYDGTASGLAATDMQGAIDELETTKASTTHAVTHSDGGSDEITVEDLATDSTDTSLVLNPDGSGGLSFGPGGITVVHTDKASDTSRANDATPSADPDLNPAIDALTTYIVHGEIFAFSVNQTPDIQVGFDIPTGTTMAIGMIGSRDGAATAQHGAKFTTSGQVQNVNIAAATVSIMSFDGEITVGATSGNLEFIWAQNNSNANNTVVQALSYLEVSPRT